MQGFSVEGQENYQEVHVKRLVLCQFLTAINLLTKGGNFVCKIFDVFTPFTAGLVYILYRIFDKICIINPYSSRPANSERYIICQGLQKRKPDNVITHLFDINDKLGQLQEKGEDILEVVDHSAFDDIQFRTYLRESNIDILNSQIDALHEIWKYLEDRELLPLNQGDVRRRCLQMWELPLAPISRNLHSALPKPQYYGNFSGHISGRVGSKNHEEEIGQVKRVPGGESPNHEKFVLNAKTLAAIKAHKA